MKKEIKRNIKRVNFLAGLILLFFVVGCMGPTQKNTAEGGYKVYFFNRTDNTFVEEDAQIEVHDLFVANENIISQLIERILKGTQSSNLGSNAFAKVASIQSSLKEQIAYIQLDDTYKNLEVEAQIALRSSIVYTLTALDFVEAVEFSIGELPLTNTSGIRVGPIARKDILTGALDPNPPTNTQTITLYFGKNASEFLYAEKREIQVNNTIPIERYIVEQLLRGPTSSDLIALLPTNTVINDIKTQDRVCQIDISYDLGNRTFSTAGHEKLLMYSIVNSLTESSRIDKVVFLMDGKKQTDGNADLRRDESLIAKDE
jgi:germination protein M